MLIKILKELVAKFSRKQYVETYKGKMFRKYCLNILNDKPQSTIEAYEDILQKIIDNTDCSTKKDAVIAYLVTAAELS